MASLLERLDHDRRVTVVPCQKPGFPEANGLTEEDCREAMWAITADGDRHRAAEAANIALSVATKSFLPIAVYSLPFVGRIQEIAYAWISRNRHRFPGVAAYCSEHPEECGNSG